MPQLSSLVRDLKAETAFTVLALARQLKAKGKDVVELEIGDSPFPTTPHAREAGIKAIEAGRTGYGPSIGLPEFRSAAARFLCREFGMEVKDENIVAGSGAKPFEQFFAEAFLEPGDDVLVFSPHFPTYIPNLQRRGANAVFTALTPERQFRPDPEAVRYFAGSAKRPRAIFLNSPQNPTGGVASTEDLDEIARIAVDADLAVFSDEPYCHMVWRGRHESILTRPGMLERTLAAYTFSKSYSMSGWRLGFAAAHPDVANAVGNLINTTASCSPPFAQVAGVAALDHDQPTRDDYMKRFQVKVERLSAGLAQIDGFRVEPPAGTFYVFPDVREICNRLQITSHGLALFLLEAADDDFGVACLGGECFGEAGQGFLRFSCAEPDERIDQALSFLRVALDRPSRVAGFLQQHLGFKLANPYPLAQA